MSDMDRAIAEGQPVFWANPAYRPEPDPEAQVALAQALTDWKAIAPLIATLWPETRPETRQEAHEDLTGAIRSPLREVPAMMRAPLGGRLFVKCDHALPVAGSVKARGGVFEVLMTARAQALEAGLLAEGQSTALLARPEARAFFAQRRIAVGSTGNLGLSVGIAARALGYGTTVHMSHDAKAWKVQRLRDLGVEVIRHPTDYSAAVAEARKIAARDPLTHFVDDEGSELLFRGYSAAGAELARQLEEAEVDIGPKHPLVVYLPCGIGGAPGGIAQGLRAVFGPYVHAFFVEPVQAPSALVQMRAGLSRMTSVYDLGLSNRTEADGMAVATMSQLVARAMQRRLAGVVTVTDDALLRGLAQAAEAGLRLEPSAASGFEGPARLIGTRTGAAFLATRLRDVDPHDIIHMVWTTGGAFVPEDQYQAFLARGRALLASAEGCV